MPPAAGIIVLRDLQNSWRHFVIRKICVIGIQVDRRGVLSYLHVFVRGEKSERSNLSTPRRNPLWFVPMIGVIGSTLSSCAYIARRRSVSRLQLIFWLANDLLFVFIALWSDQVQARATPSLKRSKLVYFSGGRLKFLLMYNEWMRGTVKMNSVSGYISTCCDANERRKRIE